MEKRCKGCGEILQSEFIDKPGYIPSKLIETNDYCKACFRLMHYGEFKDYSSSIDFDKIFESINNSNSLIVYIVDSFNINGSIIKNFSSIFKKSKVLVIVNKIDIWPKLLRKNKIVNYIKDELKANGIIYDDITTCSGLKNDNIDAIYNKIKSYKLKNVYVVGKVNSGKSTFINSLIKAKQVDESLVTTSFYPSTTLNVIKVKFNDFVLNDTPGIIDNSSIYSMVNSKNLKKVINLKETKPISMSVYNNTLLFVGSILYITFNVIDKTNLSIYGNNLIKYHKSKNEDILNKFNLILKDSLYVPKLDKEYEMDEVTFKLDGHRKLLTINGLSNIEILNGIGSITIKKPKNLLINLTNSFNKETRHDFK